VWPPTVMRMLTEYGLLCRFHGEKKEELLGVASNRVMRMRTEYGLLSRFHRGKKEELLGVASNHAMRNRSEYGLICRFHGEKKEELLGVASNRVMRMNLQTGDHIKTWRYSTMKVSKSRKNDNIVTLSPLQDYVVRGPSVGKNAVLSK
jgi:hypothetical protein